MESPQITVQTVQGFEGLGAFVYLIHFDEPRFHARHYLGSSLDLIARLTSHANGHGAALTRALWEDEQGWQLAALFIPRCRSLSVRDLEQLAKVRHQGDDYCPICRKGKHVAPRGLIQIPAPRLTSSMLRRG